MTSQEFPRLNARLGEQVMRLDQLETRMWSFRKRGLYYAPDLPPDRAETIAGNVALTLAYIELEGRK